MNYEITEEQIKQLAKGNVKVKKMFPEVFNTELEVGKWYKNEDYGNLVFMTDKFKEQDFKSKFTTFAKGYGFKFTDKKEWYDDLHFSDSREFTLATDSEVLEALTNEAKKRGFVKGAYFKEFWTKSIYKVNDIVYKHSSLDLRSNEKCLFHNGKWATLIKTYTKEEAEKLLNAKII